MKLNRQTARFVLLGLVLASMVICIQTVAIAGSGPEPGENCNPPTEGLKVKYVSPPYFVDLIATYSNNGTVSLTTTVTSPKNKDCNRTATQQTKGYTAEKFNAETSKKALQSYCIHNVVMEDGSANYLFCDTDPELYLEVIAVTQYKKVGNTVTASLIVMEITY